MALVARAHDAVAYSLTRVVHTRYGKMQGLIEESGVGAAAGAGVGAGANANARRAASTVEMFLGVPYATPPTGANRFSPTRALTPWDGVKLCDRFGPVCPQWLPNTANETEALRRMPRGRLEQLKRLLPHLRNQSEDCLYLNIYAPATGESPVPRRRPSTLLASRPSTLYSCREVDRPYYTIRAPIRPT